MALSTYKKLTKTLPNGNTYIRASTIDVLIHIQKHDLWEKIVTISLNRRYFLFGEFILTITTKP